MQNKMIALAIALAIAFTHVGCGIHHTIKGRVVNADTRQPVPGAVVAIYWERIKLLSPPGYGPDRVRYGSSDSITDIRGEFVIPKYQVGNFYLGIYKSGYICWSNETIFNPSGKTYEETYISRDPISLNNDMVIKLQPVKGKDFPVIEHARFADSVDRSVKNRKFSDATKKLRELYWENYRKRIGKDKWKKRF